MITRYMFELTLVENSHGPWVKASDYVALAAAASGIAKHACHDDNCGIHEEVHNCTCGFTSAYAALTALVPFPYVVTEEKPE